MKLLGMETCQTAFQNTIIGIFQNEILKTGLKRFDYDQFENLILNHDLIEYGC